MDKAKLFVFISSTLVLGVPCSLGGSRMGKHSLVVIGELLYHIVLVVKIWDGHVHLVHCMVVIEKGYEYT